MSTISEHRRATDDAFMKCYHTWTVAFGMSLVSLVFFESSENLLAMVFKYTLGIDYHSPFESSADKSGNYLRYTIKEPSCNKIMGFFSGFLSFFGFLSGTLHGNSGVEDLKLSDQSCLRTVYFLKSMGVLMPLLFHAVDTAHYKRTGTWISFLRSISLLLFYCYLMLIERVHDQKYMLVVQLLLTCPVRAMYYNSYTDSVTFGFVHILRASTSLASSGGSDAYDIFIASSFAVLAFAGTSLALLYNIRKQFNRSRELERVLLICMEKTRQLRELPRYLAEAHRDPKLKNAFLRQNDEYFYDWSGEGKGSIELDSTQGDSAISHIPAVEDLPKLQEDLLSGSSSQAVNETTEQKYSCKVSKGTESTTDSDGTITDKCSIDPSLITAASSGNEDIQGSKLNTKKEADHNSDENLSESFLKNANTNNDESYVDGTESLGDAYIQIMKDDFIRDCIEKNVLLEYIPAELAHQPLRWLGKCEDSSHPHALSADSGLKSSHHLVLKYCVVVAVHVAVPSDGADDLQPFGSYKTDTSLGDLEVVHRLAERHKISYVRTVGNTWLGCLGLVSRNIDGDYTTDSSELDVPRSCYDALRLCCDVQSVFDETERQITCAVDAGRIMCGFFEGQSLDLHGAEVRWVLNTCLTAKASTEAALVCISGEVKNSLEKLNSLHQQANRQSVLQSQECFRDDSSDDDTNYYNKNYHRNNFQDGGAGARDRSQNSQDEAFSGVTNDNCPDDSQLRRHKKDNGMEMHRGQNEQLKQGASDPLNLPEVAFAAFESSQAEKIGLRENDSWIVSNPMKISSLSAQEIGRFLQLLPSFSKSPEWLCNSGYGRDDTRLSDSELDLIFENPLYVVFTREKNKFMDTDMDRQPKIFEKNIRKSAKWGDVNSSTIALFGFNLDDPILDGYSGKQLTEKQSEMYHRVTELEMKHHYGSNIRKISGWLNGRSCVTGINKHRTAVKYEVIHGKRVVVSKEERVERHQVHDSDPFQIYRDFLSSHPSHLMQPFDWYSQNIDSKTPPELPSYQYTDLASISYFCLYSSLHQFKRMRSSLSQYLNYIRTSLCSRNAEDGLAGLRRKSDTRSKAASDFATLSDKYSIKPKRRADTRTGDPSSNVRMNKRVTSNVPIATEESNVSKLAPGYNYDDLWKTYNVTTRGVFKSPALKIVMSIFFILPSVYVILTRNYTMRYFLSHNEHQLGKTELFASLFFGHLISQQTLEGRYNTMMITICIIIRALLVIRFPSGVFVYGFETTESREDMSYGTERDWGGELGVISVIIIIGFPLVLSKMRMTQAWVEFAVTVLAMYGRVRTLSLSQPPAEQSYYPTAAMVASPGRGAIVSILFALLWGVYGIERSVHVAFLYETKIVPYAVAVHRKYLKQASNVLRRYLPSAPKISNHSTRELVDLSPPRSYQKCVVVAIYINASEAMVAYTEPSFYADFFSSIIAVVSQTMENFGLKLVCNACGSIVAVCPNDVDQGGEAGTDRELLGEQSCLAHVLGFIHSFQQNMNYFMLSNKCNITWSMGIDYGNVTVGFNGHRRLQYDAVGPARDLAVALSHIDHDGGVYTSDSFNLAATLASRYSARQVLLENRQVTRGVMIAGKNVKVYIIFHRSNGIGISDLEHIRLAGKGGAGSVHLVRERHTRKQYAVKVIQRKSGRSIEAFNVVQSEFLVVGQMDHPNVMDFKYVVNDDIRNRVYLVMPFVRGGTLMQVVWSLCPPIRQLIVWFAQLTAAIEYVHSKGIIHCDIKPANCLIGTDGRLKLTDFGLSKVVGYDERGRRRTIRGHSGSLISKLLPLKLYTSSLNYRVLLVSANGKKSRVEEYLREYNHSYFFVSTKDGLNAFFRSAVRVNLIIAEISPKELQEIRSKTIDENSVPSNESSNSDIDGDRLEKAADSVDLDSSDDVEGAASVLDILDLRIDQQESKTRAGLGESTDGSVRSHGASPRESSTDEMNSATTVDPIHDGKWQFSAPLVLCIPSDDASLKESMQTLRNVQACISFPLSSRDQELLTSLAYVGNENNMEEDGDEEMAEDSEANASTASGSHASLSTRNGVFFNSFIGLADSGYDHALFSGTIGSLGSSFQGSQVHGHGNSGGPSHGSSTGTSAGNAHPENTKKGTKPVGGLKGNKLIGTLAYLAPETIVKRIYTPAVDWWSLGVTIYECVAHNILFTGETRNMIMRNILIGCIQPQLKVLSIKSAEELENLTEDHIHRDCLLPCESIHKEPSGSVDEDRKNAADEAHADGHVSRLEDLVTGLLSRKRKLRLGMNGSVKDHPFFKTVKWETLNIDEALVKPPPFIPSYKHSDGKSDHDRSNARKLMERELFYGKEFPLDHQLNYRMDVGTSHGRSSSKGVTHGFLTRSAQTNKVAVPIFEDGEGSEDDDDPKSAQTSNMTTMEAGISITN